MKQKLFMLLALVCMTLTASALDAPTYSLTKADDAEAHGTITFKVNSQEVSAAAEGDVVTVTITPAGGYVVNQPSGQWYAAVAAAPRRAISLLNGITLTPVEGQANQWTFTMERANAEFSCTYKKLLTNADITIEDIAALTYTGQELTPTVVVKDGNTTLEEGQDKDYTVSYSNNINAALATATENAPTVTITAVATSDKYAGTVTKTFTINKAALTVAADNKDITYGDDAPTYTVSYTGFVNNETEAVLGGTLALACDYVKNTSGVGDYNITPSGLTSDNYDITFTAGKLTVGPKALEESMIAAIDALTYTGQALTPAPVLTFNDMTLEEGTDYTVSYSNNINAALATATENAPTVTITAVAGSDYSGTATATFAIQKADITMTTAPAAVSGLVYSGEAQTLITAGVASFGTVLYSLDGTTFSDALPQGTDAGTYTVTYKVEGDDNHNAFAAQTLNVTIATDKTALNNVITEAEAFYSTISESNPDAAAALLEAINTAKGVQGNANATQSEVETAAQTLYAKLMAAAAQETVILADGDTYTRTLDMTVASATYKKSIAEERVGLHQAWLVPFDYTLTSDDMNAFSFYKINMIANAPNPETEASDDIWVFLKRMNEGEVLHANMPYAYRAKSAVDNYEFTTAGAMLKAKTTDARITMMTAEDTYTLYGTYGGTTATAEDPFYYVNINGDLSLGNDGTVTVGAYRWIMRVESKFGSTPAYARNVHFFDGEDSETMGISLTPNPSPRGEGSIYTLDGRRVAQPKKGGLYIVNGKKVVIK